MIRMDTVFFLAYPLAVAAGLITFTISVQLVRSYQSPFFRAFLVQIMIFNLLILLGLFLGYAGMRLAAGSSFGWLEQLPGWVWAAVSLVKFIWLYSFIVMIRLLVGEEITTSFRLRFAGASVGIFLINSTMIIVSEQLEQGGGFTRSYSLVEWSIIAGAILGTLYLFLRAPRMSSIMRGAVRLFASIYLSTFLLVTLVISVSTSLYPDRTEITMQLNSLFLILYNLLPLIWIIRYRHIVALMDSSRASSDHLPEHFMNELSITRREREVLALACAGKTNQEIANTLFISLQTVKDHVYSIYRKTGVRNRVELANMFRQNGSGKIQE